MIEVFINGEGAVVDESQSLAAVLAAREYSCARIAVAVNNEFVARADYDSFFLKADDRVDVVAPVAGG